MDIRMKGMDGLEASRKILGEFPEAKILLLTTFSDDEYIIKALRLGTKGYLLKQDYASILPALQAVYSGQTVFGTEIMSKIPELLQSSDGFDYASRNINERELDIIRLIANGYSNKEIAAELFLSEGTVRNYLSSILDKLQLRTGHRLLCFIISTDKENYNEPLSYYPYPGNSCPGTCLPLSSHPGRSYKKQISQAKFRPSGVQKTDSSAV